MNDIFAADLHTHSRLCRHAVGDPAEYVESAARRKIKAIGLSDHFPAPSGYDAEFRMRPQEWQEYCRMVRRAKEVGASLGVEVLFGTEYDFVPGRMNEVSDTLERLQNEAGMRFDYLIGSVHFVDGFAFDDPDKKDDWQKYGIDSVWERYLDLLQQFTEEHSFSVMAHPDLPKKFGFFHSDPEYIRTRFRSIFDIAARKNICIELNTAGLRVPADEIYPGCDLLKIAFDAGLPISFGSDAHAPDLVGYGFSRACACAKSVGWRSASFFRQGERIEYAIPDF